MKIKKGDTVVAISGSDKGKQGEIIRVIPKKEKVVVKGVNVITKHLKRTKERSGERVQYEAPIHISNVMLLNEDGKSVTRVGYSLNKEGKKVRVAKKTGNVIKNTFKKS